MPLYEYECEACGRVFEVFRRYDEPPIQFCVECGGAVHRKYGGTFVFRFRSRNWRPYDAETAGGEETVEEFRADAGD